MNYWLTTHWPHPFEVDHAWDVYLPSHARSEAASRKFQRGDLVVFYEVGKGKDEVGQPPLPHGRVGTVAYGYVAGAPLRRDVTIRHTDGTESSWAWAVPCDRHDFAGYLSSAETAAALGSPNYRFRGVGGGLGVMPLDEEQASRIVRAFKFNLPEPVRLRHPR